MTHQNILEKRSDPYLQYLIAWSVWVANRREFKTFYRKVRTKRCGGLYSRYKKSIDPLTK